jgi:hypothetical protein
VRWLQRGSQTGGPTTRANKNCPLIDRWHTHAASRSSPAGKGRLHARPTTWMLRRQAAAKNTTCRAAVVHPSACTRPPPPPLPPQNRQHRRGPQRTSRPSDSHGQSGRRSKTTRGYMVVSVPTTRYTPKPPARSLALFARVKLEHLTRI